MEQVSEPVIIYEYTGLAVWENVDVDVKNNLDYLMGVVSCIPLIHQLHTYLGYQMA